jgi:23S rRNA pseudouridine1911/1915/1917 synthase
MSDNFEFIIEEVFAGKRLDKCLPILIPEHSRSYLQKQVKAGNVKVNGEVCTTPRVSLAEGDKVELVLPKEHIDEVIAEDIDLPIIYEDEDMIVINKPAGIIVHPGAGNHSGTIVNALAGRDKSFLENLDGSEFRPGVVHRLDKDTSGCLVVAKNQRAMHRLSNSFAERNTHKVYAALTYGIPKKDKSKIVTMIGRHKVNRKKMAVVDRGGKQAITKYEVCDKGRIQDHTAALLRVEIETGRTHQIRVHMAHLRSPIIGDKVYGGSQAIDAPRQMLHAWQLTIPHPIRDKKMMSFEAPFPEDFEVLAEELNQNSMMYTAPVEEDEFE